MHTNNYGEWIEFVSTTMQQKKSNRMLKSLHSHGFFGSRNFVNIKYSKQFPVQVKFRLRLQLRNVIKI
jgi:DNA polymerase III delta subunit